MPAVVTVQGSPANASKKTRAPLPASASSLSATHLAQHFSSADDLSLLAFYRELGPMYKTISRRMVPQRHKQEVRERIESLRVSISFDEQSSAELQLTLSIADCSPTTLSSSSRT